RRATASRRSDNRSARRARLRLRLNLGFEEIEKPARQRAGSPIANRPAVAPAYREDPFERARDERLLGPPQILGAEQLLAAWHPLAAGEIDHQIARDPLENPRLGRRGQQPALPHQKDVARGPLRQPLLRVEEERLVRS